MFVYVLINVYMTPCVYFQARHGYYRVGYALLGMIFVCVMLNVIIVYIVAWGHLMAGYGHYRVEYALLSIVIV